MCGRFGIHTDAITGRGPFIMRGPGVEAGKLDTGLHSSLDPAARVTGRGEAADRLAAKHARDLA